MGLTPHFFVLGRILGSRKEVKGGERGASEARPCSIPSPIPAEEAQAKSAATVQPAERQLGVGR